MKTSTCIFLSDQRIDIDALWGEFRPYVSKLAFAMTRTPEEAEDLVQDVFERATRYLTFMESPQPAAVCAWLREVTRNLAIDRSRRRKKIQWCSVEQGATPNNLGDECVGFEFPDERYQPDALHAPIFREELQERVREAVAKLPDHQRSIIVLFYIHHYEVKEIARMLNLPEGTVKSRLHRARAAMERTLGRYLTCTT